MPAVYPRPGPLSAGYGRKDAAEQLLKAGASPTPLNARGQTPADAAKQNREMHMVTFMEAHTASSSETSKYL